jgi:hypothetical protein
MLAALCRLAIGGLLMHRHDEPFYGTTLHIAIGISLVRPSITQWPLSALTLTLCFNMAWHDVRSRCDNAALSNTTR